MPKLGDYLAARAERDAAIDPKTLLAEELIQLPEEPDPDYFNETEPEPDYFG